MLARYRYARAEEESDGAGLAELVLVVPGGRAAAAGRGAERGRVLADAAQLARDLANTPPGHLTASRMADVAIAVAASSGLDVEVFDEDALAALGCGGLLGVNAGSDRAAAHDQAHRTARRRPGRPPGDGRQGRDVRLRRHQPEADAIRCTRR